jgi:acylphosphatase
VTDADEIRQWTVTGRVQRVGFRMFVEREATRLGL